MSQTALPERLERYLNSLSPTQRRIWLEKAEASLEVSEQPNSFTDFKHRYWKGYQHVRHHQAIGEKLVQVANYIKSEGKEGISRLIIEAPPRHGKSRSTSEYFPAWMLSQLPDLPIIMTSYAARLAHRNSKAVRRILARSEYRAAFPETRLAGGRVDSWLTTADGGIIAAGVGGSVTGEGARLIIIDDPVRSRADAESPTKRQTVKDWYSNDLITRLEEPGGAVILMLTRWQIDDLAGWLMSEENEDGDQWEVLRLPALAEENDPLGREPGEALWPERYGIEWIEKQRRRVGSYGFAALYQQEPTTKEASLFDTGLIKTVDTIPELKKVVRFWDLAVSGKSTADYSVGLKLGLKTDGSYIVLDVFRKQQAPTGTSESIIARAAVDGTTVRIRLEAENSARVQLDFLLKDERMKPYTIDAKTPQGDKYTRATPVASRVNAGQLTILKAGWNRAFLDELSVFPSRAHDDQCDALSGAYDMLTTYLTPRVRYTDIFDSNYMYNSLSGSSGLFSHTGIGIQSDTFGPEPPPTEHDREMARIRRMKYYNS